MKRILAVVRCGVRKLSTADEKEVKLSLYEFLRDFKKENNGVLGKIQVYFQLF